MFSEKLRCKITVSLSENNTRGWSMTSRQPYFRSSFRSIFIGVHLKLGGDARLSTNITQWKKGLTLTIEKICAFVNRDDERNVWNWSGTVNIDSVVPESSETDGGAVRFGRAYWPLLQLKQEDTRRAQSTRTTPHSIRMISLKSNWR